MHRIPLILFLLAGLVVKGSAQTGAKKPEKPFSPYVTAGDFIFISGQVAADPETGKLIEGDIKAQTAQALKNIERVLKDAGSGPQQVVKTTVFLKNIEDFASMNEVYIQFFQGKKPARSTVAVAGLVLGALVEIEAVVYHPMVRPYPAKSNP
jgi:2-iminobutanoate/2-iminopropanoate deaminase